MSQCGISSSLLPGHQAEAWPAGGEFPSTGYPFSAGQTIRLHSEYQNDTGRPQIDVMGIMMAWYVPDVAGLPAPQVGARPTQVSLVPAYNQCTSPNRVHGPPDFPGNGSNPDGSCNPPAADLEPAHGRHARRQRRAVQGGGLREGRRDHRQRGHARRRGRRALPGLDDRRAPQRPPASPTTRASCSSTRRSAVIDRTTARRRSATVRTRPSG